MLIYFEPAARCDQDTDFILAPLPTKKQVWEASNELAWKAECEKEPAGETIFGLASNGELVKMAEGLQYSSNVMMLRNLFSHRTPLMSSNNWEEWCSGMDGLGGLVMLAASLVE
jgi:hypothetical protein